MTHGFKNGDYAKVKATGQIVRLENVNHTDRWKDDENFADGVYDGDYVEILSPYEIVPSDPPDIDSSEVAAAFSNTDFADPGWKFLRVLRTEGDKVFAAAEFKGHDITFTLTISHAEVK